MKKYLVMYCSTMSAREQMAKASPEQGKVAMDMWMAWMKKAGAALVDGGAPLAPVGAARAQVGGYSVLQATNEKSLLALLEDHPHRHAPGATFEVYEFQHLPGMG